MGLLGNLLLRGGADKGADIAERIGQGALVVDTRTAGEYAGGSIEGAVNIPYDIIARSIGQYETDKSRPIVVFCHSGARSSAAKKQLEQAGYTNVVNGGGIGHMRRQLGK